MMGVGRNRRTRLFESIRSNREKIGRAMDRLRDAMVRRRKKTKRLHKKKKNTHCITTTKLRLIADFVTRGIECKKQGRLD